MPQLAREDLGAQQHCREREAADGRLGWQMAEENVQRTGCLASPAAVASGCAWAARGCAWAAVRLHHLCGVWRNADLSIALASRRARTQHAKCPTMRRPRRTRLRVERLRLHGGTRKAVACVANGSR